MDLAQLVHVGTFKDVDETIKSVYKSDRGIIEMTFISNKGSSGVDVYCVPTHHYCNLGCKLCHLTAEGADKKRMVLIQTGEFLEGLSRTAFKKSPAILSGKSSELLNRYQKRSNNKKCLISFMGVGEPLLNLDLVKGVFKQQREIGEICDYETFSYALATMMPNYGLGLFSEYVKKEEFPLKVHFSMHSPFTNERFDLLPKTRVSVRDAFLMLADYRAKLLSVPSIAQNLLCSMRFLIQLKFIIH
jgi:adenine C2-methylase RlmN of 23S rRNA A2503 and tRNA A37